MDVLKFGMSVVHLLKTTPVICAQILSYSSKKRSLARQMVKWHSENKHLYGPVLKTKKKKDAKTKKAKKKEKVFNGIENSDRLDISHKSEIFWSCEMPSSMSNIFDDKSNTEEHLPAEYHDSEDDKSTDSFTASDFAFDLKTGRSVSKTVNMEKQSKNTVNHYRITDEDLQDTTMDVDNAVNGDKPLYVDLSPLLEFPLVLPNKAEVERAWPHVCDFDKYFTNSSYRYPSVSKILEQTKPPESVAILERWKKMMIAQLGEEGFNKHQQETFLKGRLLHEHIQNLLSGSIELTDLVPSVEPEVRGHWQSIEHVFANISGVQLLETPTRHPYLKYGGIVDCVAVFRDQLCVIEWKTSKKRKRTLQDLYDYPLQVAAYMGALNSLPDLDFQVNSGLVVVAYEDGQQADIHWMSEEQCESWWEKWINRLHQYWMVNIPPLVQH